MGITYCFKCLLSEMNEEEFFQSIRTAIDAIPASNRTEAAVYEARLNACKACDRLLNGMCLISGDYVEVRAAKKSQDCPQVHSNWKKDSAE